MCIEVSAEYFMEETETPIKAPPQKSRRDHIPTPSLKNTGVPKHQLEDQTLRVPASPLPPPVATAPRNICSKGEALSWELIRLVLAGEMCCSVMATELVRRRPSMGHKIRSNTGGFRA
jgi:hypothetical protein